jgi:hypothetical protein
LRSIHSPRGDDGVLWILTAAALILWLAGLLLRLGPLVNLLLVLATVLLVVQLLEERADSPGQ